MKKMITVLYFSIVVAGITGGVQAGEKIVVFPFEQIGGIEHRVVNASTDILQSALTSAGFEVIDWKRGYYKVTGSDSERMGQSAVLGTAPVDVVNTPQPTAPIIEATPEGAVESTPDTQAEIASPPPSPVEPVVIAKAAPRLTVELKAQIAEAEGCANYIDGKLVRLGSRIRISVHKKNRSGATIRIKEMDSKNEDDLLLALERIALALSKDVTEDETLSLDNATRAEAHRRANRFRMEKNFGLMIGGTFGLADSAADFVLLGFNGRLEAKDLLIIINAGFGWSGDDELASEDDYGLSENTSMIIFADLGVAYYLSHTPISPYLGGGVGVYFGDRIKGESRYKNDSVGIEVFPVLGLELLRNTAIRLHIEGRYSILFAADNNFGHGPAVVAGITF